MNLLIEKAPDYIMIDGKKTHIKTDFSLWVKFLICSSQRKENEMLLTIKEIFGEFPKENTPNKVTNAIMKWLHPQRDENQSVVNYTGNTNTGLPFDYEIDGNVIYCELWEYFPHLMEKGISYHEGVELIKLLIANDKTMLHHRAFARCGDFSKMSREMMKYWLQERARYTIKAKQEDIDAVLSNGF